MKYEQESYQYHSYVMVQRILDGRKNSKNLVTILDK